jgi:prolipoprotein diacylglyceryltransferase
MFEAFQFGPATIWMRVAFLLLAIWMSAEFFFRLAKSAGLSLQNIRDDAKWHLAAFLLGGRLFAIFANYQMYVKNWLRIFIVWDGEFSFIGASLGIALVLFLVTNWLIRCRHRQLRLNGRCCLHARRASCLRDGFGHPFYRLEFERFWSGHII